MRSRIGVALFAAIALMAVIALLLAGGFAAAMLADRSSTLMRTDAAIGGAADYALATVLSGLNEDSLVDAPLGQASTFSEPSSDAGVATIVSVTRLPGALLWIVSDAELPGPPAGRRRYNLVAQFPVADRLPLAALMSRGDIHIGGDVTLLRDTTSDPECLVMFGADAVVAPGARVSGVLASGDSVRVQTQTAAADSSAYQLTSRRLALLDSGRGVIHVRGDTTIAGGVLSGILIADGSVTVSSPFRVNGLIVARGRISAVSGSLSVVGALMAFEPPGGDPAIDLAGASVSFAPCVVARALRWAVGARQVPKRAWAEIF